MKAFLSRWLEWLPRLIINTTLAGAIAFVVLLVGTVTEMNQIPAAVEKCFLIAAIAFPLIFIAEAIEHAAKNRNNNVQGS